MLNVLSVKEKILYFVFIFMFYLVSVGFGYGVIYFFSGLKTITYDFMLLSLFLSMVSFFIVCYFMYLKTEYLLKNNLKDEKEEENKMITLKYGFLTGVSLLGSSFVIGTILQNNYLMDVYMGVMGVSSIVCLLSLRLVEQKILYGRVSGFQDNY